MLRRLPHLTLLVGLVACGDSAGPGSGPVASVAIVSGDLQRGPAGAELPNPLVVRVLDAEGNPVQGQVINFRVVAGGGSVFAGSGISNAQGRVQERWTLGHVYADTQRVEARAVDATTGEPIVYAVFRALASVAESGSLSIFIDGVYGPGISEVVIGQTLDRPILVQAYDEFGFPAAGLEVSFTVTGGGSVPSPTARTDASGFALLESWTMGTVPGLNTLTVSAPGFQPATLEAIGITRAAFEVKPAAIDLTVDSMVRLTPIRLDPAGDTMPNPPVQYRSLDPAVATVSSDGLVAGIATGQARIVATSDELADTMAVTVAMGFTAVSVGTSTACAIRTGGEARCWGSDEFGQLGDGPGNSDGTASVPVAGGLSFREIGTSRNLWGSESFTCGLTTTGTAYCWGGNSAGQLGTGGASAHSPQPVAGGLTFTALAVGGEHACAIATGGKAYCWGGNSRGQLGTGDSTNRAQPTAVAGNLEFTALGLGVTHTCGVTDGGDAFCWGDGGNGRLGQGSTEGSPTPVAVAGGLSFKAVTGGRSHSCGLTTAGQAYCWGDNFMTQLGNGRYLLTDFLTPEAVTGGKTWIALSAGLSTSCGIAADGSAWCWGHSGEHGNLGHGQWDTGNHYAEPQLVVGFHRFSSISIGGQFGGGTCAVSTNSGTPVYCWGRFPALVTGF